MRWLRHHVILISLSVKDRPEHHSTSAQRLRVARRRGPSRRPRCLPAYAQVKELNFSTFLDRKVISTCGTNHGRFRICAQRADVTAYRRNASLVTGPVQLRTRVRSHEGTKSIGLQSPPSAMVTWRLRPRGARGRDETRLRAGHDAVTEVQETLHTAADSFPRRMRRVYRARVPDRFHALPQGQA